MHGDDKRIHENDQLPPKLGGILYQLNIFEEKKNEFKIFFPQLFFFSTQ